MTKQAKVQLRQKEAWEYLSDWTSSKAEQVRRDRLTADDHVHNLYPYPRIMVLKGGSSQAAPELGCRTPSRRSTAKRKATEQLNQENPTRPLKRSY